MKVCILNKAAVESKRIDPAFLSSTGGYKISISQTCPADLIIAKDGLTAAFLILDSSAASDLASEESEAWHRCEYMTNVPEHVQLSWPQPYKVYACPMQGGAAWQGLPEQLCAGRLPQRQRKSGHPQGGMPVRYKCTCSGQVEAQCKVLLTSACMQVLEVAQHHQRAGRRGHRHDGCEAVRCPARCPQRYGGAAGASPSHMLHIMSVPTLRGACASWRAGFCHYGKL